MNRLVLFSDTGFLGNRLVTFSYLLAFGRERRVAVTNLCLWRFAHYFAAKTPHLDRPWLEMAARGDDCDQSFGRAIASVLEYMPDAVRRKFMYDNRLCCRPSELRARLLGGLFSRGFLRYRVIRKLVPPSVCCREEVIRSNTGGDVGERVRYGHHCALLAPQALAGENLFQHALVEKHADYLRARFRLAASFGDQVEAFLGPLRQRYRILVGVHRRHGDYKVYRSGKWFFHDPVYLRAITHFRDQLGSDDVEFVIASNEPYDSASFRSTQFHRAPGDMILDMYVLAGCDMIIGPPSTFSGWASFFGNKPLYQINDASLHDIAEPAASRIWLPQFY